MEIYKLFRSSLKFSLQASTILVKPLLFLFLLLSISTTAQNVQINGKVSDENGAMIGATVQLINIDSQYIFGEHTDAEGSFSIDITPSEYMLAVSYVGYEDYVNHILISGNDIPYFNITLKKGISLTPAIVTYDRTGGKKTVELPASISILSNESFKKMPSVGVESYLAKLHGVHVANIGIDRNEIALRGLNQPLNNQLLVLADFLPQWSASDGNYVYNAMAIPAIDMERVEVIRGGVGPIYGPGSVYGTIHFISQSPFDYPGTSVQIMGGNRNYFGGAFRHADIFGKKNNWAYKLVGELSSAEDWGFDKNTTEDFQLIAGDINPRDYTTQKVRLKGEMRYRFGKEKKSEFINTLSYTNNKFLLTAPDAVQVQGAEVLINHWRFRSGGLWLQGSMSRAFGEPSLVLQVPDPIEAEKPFHLYNRNSTFGFQGQYAFDIFDEWQSFILGGDFNNRKLNSKDLRKDLLDEMGIEERSTSYGRYESRAKAKTYGVFVHSNTALIKNKLNLNASFRLDANQINADKVLPSSFFGLNYQPNENNSIRVSVQRGWTNIPLSDYYKDRELSFVRDLGNVDGFNFSRENGNPVFSRGPASQLAFFAQLNPFLEDYETTSAVAHNAILDGLEFFISSNLDEPVTLERIGFFNESWQAILLDLLPLINSSNNALGTNEPMYALTQITGQPVLTEHLENIAPLKDYYWDVFEFGYKGHFRDKLNISLDIFYNRAERTQLETIVTPSINLRNAELFEQARAVFLENEPMQELLASAGLTLDDWMVIYENFASAPMYIWETEQNNRFLNGEAELLQSSFLTPKGIDYWGLSMEVKYSVRQDIIIYGSYSHLSKEQWGDEELGLPGTGFRKTMNAPPHAIKIGGSYFPKKGFSISADALWEDGFPFLERTFVGDIDSRFLLSGSLGYDLSLYFKKLKKVRVDLSVSNIFNKKYRAFLGAPRIGRFALLRLSVEI